jgi:ABC-2 type transport system permease protein
VDRTRTSPHYGRVFWTFLRNALVREMTFRGNFIITVLTRAFWFAAQLTLFEIIYSNVDAINDWTREEYFAFMATGMLINAIVETFFMPNCANFSELIRTGNLDFALLKPIDTQFLISFEKVDIANLNQILLAGGLLGYSLYEMQVVLTPLNVAMYLILIAAGVWFGRNQGLYDFWFYITVFARYPREIYGSNPDGRTPSEFSEWAAGDVLQFSFSYIIPILLVVTVPARVLLSKPLDPRWLVSVAIIAPLLALLVSRAVFHWSLKSYRSASS